MLFIYWLEDKQPYSERLAAIHRRMSERGDSLFTSSFTLGELLVGPEKQKDSALKEKILAYFASGSLELVPFTSNVAKLYGQIRANCKVTPGDAIHLASAAEVRVDLFLTNDLELRKLVVPGIKFIDGLETSVLGPFDGEL